MKKLYFSIVLMLAAFVSAEAKVVTLSVNLASPAPSAILTCGVPFTQTIIVTVSGSIVPADTFLYADPYIPQGNAYVRVGLTKNTGDTILMTKSVTLTTSNTNGPHSYCVLAAVRNGSTITPDSIWTKCNNVTVAGGTSQGVGELQAVQTVMTSNLKIYPNPASSIVNLDYAAQNNSAVVATVYDVTGRQVMVQNFGASYVGKTGFKLNLESLNNGLYIVELRQDGVKSVGRVNKN